MRCPPPQFAGSTATLFRGMALFPSIGFPMTTVIVFQWPLLDAPTARAVIVRHGYDLLRVPGAVERIALHHSIDARSTQRIRTSCWHSLLRLVCG